MPWEIGKNIIVTTGKIFGINCLFFKEWFSVAFQILILRNPLFRQRCHVNIKKQVLAQLSSLQYLTRIMPTLSQTCFCPSYDYLVINRFIARPPAMKTQTFSDSMDGLWQQQQFIPSSQLLNQQRKQRLQPTWALHVVHKIQLWDQAEVSVQVVLMIQRLNFERLSFERPNFVRQNFERPNFERLNFEQHNFERPNFE